MLSKLYEIKKGPYWFDYDTGEMPLKWMMFQAGYQNRKSHDYRIVRQPTGELPFHYTIWQYTVSGEGTLLYDGQEYSVRPGQAMILNNTDYHEYFLPEHSKNWEFFWINLTGSDALAFWEHIQSAGPVKEFPEDGETVELGKQLISNAATGELPATFSSSELAYRFAMSVARTVGAGNRRQLHPLVEKVRMYCLHRLDEPISVDELTSLTGLSRYHFSRKFKEISGHSPGEYLTRIRMQRARNLLEAGDASVKAVALQCGYHDPSYFCKVFRKYFGASPGSYSQ